MNKKELQKIERSTVDRYSARFREGNKSDAQILGWGTRQYQQKRFAELLRAAERDDFERKVVLDIGCGFGDLYEFFKSKNIRPKAYKGIDINDDLLREARKRHKKVQFDKRDIVQKPFRTATADTAVALGVINFKVKRHEEYAKTFIQNAFDSVRNALIVNVISDVHNQEYPREPFIYYYKPEVWLKFAQQMTPYCSLIHDYKASPQNECMLILRKKPWDAHNIKKSYDH